MMTKSELIERIVEQQQGQLTAKDVELAIKTMLEHMSATLAAGERIEIRGVGNFSPHHRAPRLGRNPKTGESVGLEGRYVPSCEPGTQLRARVKESLESACAAYYNTRCCGILCCLRGGRGWCCIRLLKRGVLIGVLLL